MTAKCVSQKRASLRKGLGLFSHGARALITGHTQGRGAIFTSRNFVSGASSTNLRSNNDEEHIYQHT